MSDDSETRDWCLPVDGYNFRRVEVSQGYNADTHHGVDLMFRRVPGDDDGLTVGTPNGSTNYVMPDGVLVLAAADATLWSSGLSAHGHFVVLDHGPPWATFYQHMSSLLVPEGVQNGAGGVSIMKGQPLGVVGFSPIDEEKLMHLHFEMWHGGGAESHVDPQGQGIDTWPQCPPTGLLQNAAVGVGAFALGTILKGGGL